MITLLATTLVIVLAVMATLWLVSLVLGDASIVDAFWGPGFVLVTTVAILASDGALPRRRLALALVALWGFRLGGHILWRNWGQGEDYRYRAMRARAGDRFAAWSLVQIFGLQGVLLWIVALPLQIAVAAPTPSVLGALDLAAVVVFACGLAFEAIGDWQLARFKATPSSTGQVMDRGLWAWTRHPNYFGDAVVWWGFFLLALATGAAWTIVSPLLMTWLLLRLSGVPLLERKLRKTRPAYADYVARTSAFVPWPPRRTVSDRSRR